MLGARRATCPHKPRPVPLDLAAQQACHVPLVRLWQVAGEESRARRLFGGWCYCQGVEPRARPSLLVAP